MGVLPAEPFWHGLNRVAGLWTGPGFVVWIFWIAQWVQKRHRSNRLWIRMLAALGQMSMTGYVLQSVLFTIIMVPWGLAIGAGRGAATVTPHCRRYLGGHYDFCLPVVTHHQAWATRDSAPYPRIWEAIPRRNTDNVICHGLGWYGVINLKVNTVFS